MARSEATERAYRAYYNGDWQTCAKEASLALNENASDAEALQAAGVSALYRSEYGLAIALLRSAIAINPDLQSAWVSLGIVHKKQFRYGDAQNAWAEALRLNPRDFVTMSNMATLFANAGEPEAAEKWCRKALEIEPGMADATRNLSMVLLEMEQWREGWECFEARAVNQTGLFTRNYWRRGQTPRWKGEEGQTVVFYGEQGVGDELLFVSILPDAIKRCKRAIFDCHPRLVDTFKRSFPGLEVHGTRKDAKIEWAEGLEIDAAIGVGSLGSLFRNANEDFPGTPYIVPDREEVIRHRRGSGRLRVGISWLGGTAETYRNYRSIPLEQWTPILSQDADFYSFQYDADSAKQCADLEEKTGIHIRHYPGRVEAQNYDKTINFAASMDLLITVCGTLFHVGGSLGIPTWCLTPHKAAWRYGRTGQASRWYGSGKLYRQFKDEEWAGAINRVASDLRLFGRKYVACVAAE